MLCIVLNAEVNKGAARDGRAVEQILCNYWKEGTDRWSVTHYGKKTD
jgi:hypothetical protein